MSVLGKKWKVASKVKIDEFESSIKYDPLIRQLLYNRGLKSKNQINDFFKFNYVNEFYDPFLLTDMKRAVERIKRAVLNKERVAIFGDYDADGVTSSVLLMEFFRDILALKGQVYIPDRVTEGYGMNMKAIDWLSKKDIQLIVSCDCGVSNKEEIDYAKNLGIDVIITDHHHLPHEFSRKYIVIDPKRKGDKYPFKELAGVGVAFKLVQAVFKSNKKILKNNNSDFIRNSLDLVAIGTVADCSPIISENRILVKYGLEIMSRTKRAGLKAIIDKAGINTGKLDTNSIGFVISPRINAAGRLDHANTAYKLLTTKNISKADIYSDKLQSSNQRRQRLTDEITAEAKNKIGKITKKNKILMARGKNWPLGVVGIVAGRLSEEFCRPALVAGEGKEESVGSARSSDKFNIIEAISSCSDILLEYGGHSKAAGFTVKNNKVKEFFLRLEKIAEKEISDIDLVSTLKIDALVSLPQINWDFYEELKKFEPFGVGNEKPIFLIKNVKIIDVFTIGNTQKHIKLKVSSEDGQHFIDAVGFDFSKYLENIKKNDIIDLVAEIDCHDWNRQKSLQLIIRDIAIK